MYKDQILYTNTNTVCYLQFLMSTSHGGNKVHIHVTCNSAKLPLSQPLNENVKKMLQYRHILLYSHGFPPQHPTG